MYLFRNTDSNDELVCLQDFDERQSPAIPHERTLFDKKENIIFIDHNQPRLMNEDKRVLQEKKHTD